MGKMEISTKFIFQVRNFILYKSNINGIIPLAAKKTIRLVSSQYILRLSTKYGHGIFKNLEV
jgi:hypothetical protein